jgi:signal transduction histidine kinase
MFQAMNNLIGLAVGSAREGSVDISVSEREGVIECSVSGKFLEDGLSLSTKDNAKSIGLFVSRAIIEGHGGKMSLEGLGSDGTKFIFTLPKEEK